MQGFIPVSVWSWFFMRNFLPVSTMRSASAWSAVAIIPPVPLPLSVGSRATFISISTTWPWPWSRLSLSLLLGAVFVWMSLPVLSDKVMHRFIIMGKIEGLKISWKSTSKTHRSWSSNQNQLVVWSFLASQYSMIWFSHENNAIQYTTKIFIWFLNLDIFASSHQICSIQIPTIVSLMV